MLPDPRLDILRSPMRTADEHPHAKQHAFTWVTNRVRVDLGSASGRVWYRLDPGRVSRVCQEQLQSVLFY